MKTITHPELVAALVKPGADILATLDPKKADLWHSATGISGEAGEICGVLFNFVDADPMVLDDIHLTEELGDMEFYLQQLRTNIGVTRDDVYAVATDFIFSKEPMIMACSIAISASDVLDQVKKHVVYNKDLDMDALMLALVKLEAGITIIRNLSGIEYETVLDKNIEKLSVRYASLSYSDDAAQARADKA